MHTAFRSLLPRWTVRLSAAAGLVFIPACGMSSALRQPSDHVFSARSPQELEHQAGSIGVPVKAEYPDEASVRVSDRQAMAGTVSAEVSAWAPGATPQTAAVSYGTAPAVTDAQPAAAAVNSSLLEAIAEAQAGAATAAPAMQQPAAGEHRSSRPAADAAGQTATVQPVAWQPDAEDRAFHLASYRPQESAARVQRATFIPSEPRQDCPPGGVPMNQMETVAAGAMADHFPDEYVFDGGDRGAPVHYGAGDRLGLESEDTIAEFADHTGRQRMKPSNRVAVYAPRFGSVRTVSGLETDIRIDRAAGARDAVGVGNLKTGQRGETNVRATGLVGLEGRHRVDGMETALPPSQAARLESPVLSRKVDQGFEDRKYSGAGQLGKLDTPILSQQLQNAVVWTRDLFPQITVNTTGAGEITANFRLQQTVGVEDQRRTTGDLRIIKLADRSVAQAGDTVVFTIQFENVGDFDVYDVRIVDNLTPRLEYIEGTASIDENNPGEVTVTPNGEGSHILTFTLDNPLKGHTGGVITFEARVR